MYVFSVTSNSVASRWWTPVGLAVFLVGFILTAPALAVGAVSTGKITLTVGQATITSASGAVTAAQRGDAISVGDRIETTLNGHVHVRFIDGALVSVRPASELLVEDYRYDPAAAERSQVKFKLSRGTARAISGAAAEGARDHFRLNTPLVAIGIRGTDFVVHSEDRMTTAAVRYGAIIMAPFGEGCKVQGSGPCATASARLLSADMSGMLAEYRSGVSQTELKQAVTSNAQMSDLAKSASLGSFKASSTSIVASSNSNSNTSNSAAPSPASGLPSASSTVTPEASLVAVNELPHIPYRANNLVDPGSRSADQMTILAAQTVENVRPSTPVIIPVPVTTSTPTPASTSTLTSTSILAPPPTPVVIVPPAVVPVTLAWGRWSNGPLGPDDFAVARADANTDRTVTVGNSKFVLYRDQGEFNFARFPAGQSETTFLLDKGFAQYTDGNGKTSAASVLGGTLGINFSTKQFDTALGLSSAATGAQTLAMQGTVDRNGLFVAAQDGQRVAGAIALDGKSAGYLFDKAAASGTLSGITQWKAK